MVPPLEPRSAPTSEPVELDPTELEPVEPDPAEVVRSADEFSSWKPGEWQPWSEPKPPDPWRPNRSNALILGGVVLALVAGAYLVRDFLPAPTSDLAVGDCIDEPATGAVIFSLQLRPCGAPHDGEVVFVGDYEASIFDRYPGVDAFDGFAAEHCLPAFEAYTGRSYQLDPDLEIGMLHPIEHSWRRFDREIICYVYRIDGAQLIDSVRLGG